MKSKIQKWGNSLAVRIPWGFAKDLGLEEGSAIDVKLNEEGIHVRPLATPRFQLADLVSRITAENLHGEVDPGPSVGRESW